MIKLLFNGVIIGIANIIPGVSGGTMAVSMGVYDKLIHALTHIRSECKKSLALLLPIIIGAVVGIAGLAFVIEFLLSNYPVQTNFLFIGLIIGGVPLITKAIGKLPEKLNLGTYFIGFCFFLLVVILAILGEGSGSVVAISTSPIDLLKLFLMGALASAAMVIPGISGSMLLMLLGYYHTITASITDFVNALRTFDTSALANSTAILLPFGIGIIIGIVVIAKMVDYLFTALPRYAYMGILGLILASPIAIILMSDLSKYNPLSIMTGILALGLGLILSKLLGEK